MELTFFSIVLLIFSITVILAIWHLSSTRKRKQELSETFINSLIDIIEERFNSAIEKLQQLAKTQPENTYALVLLGDLLREKGDPKKGFKVHQLLLARKGLTTNETVRVMKSVALDYYALSDDIKAVEIAEKALSIDESNPFFLELLLEEYEKLGEWEKALETGEKLERFFNIENKRLKAFFKLGAGLNYIDEGDGHKARLLFKDAIKFDSTCFFAYKFIGDSYLSENRLDDAIDWYKKFLEQFPHNSYLVLDNLEKAYFEKGEFEKSIETYKELLSKQPENKQVTYRLAELYIKMGELQKAINIIENNARDDELEKLVKLLVYNKELGKIDEMNKYIERLYKLLDAHKPIFICKECGEKTKEELWRCPKCMKVDTFISG